MATSAAACLDNELAPLAESEQPIIGGRPELGYDAAVALVSRGEAFCSGTLVRPTVVITAAHCLAEDRPEDISVFFGDDASQLDRGELIPAAGAWMHPQYDDFEVVNDIGVVTLSRAAAATPIEAQTAAMTGQFVGQNAVFVGFGVTDPYQQTMGVKSSVAIPIEDLEPTTFTYASPNTNTCFGDSGGPAFHVDASGTTRLIGVTSWGDEECKEFGVNTRVDAYLDFLQPFLDGQTAPSVGGGIGAGGDDWCAVEGWYNDGVCDEDCPSPDPDCGGGGDPGEGADDWCAAEGWYGDGVCDEDCPNPDPDCSDDTSWDGPGGGSAGCSVAGRGGAGGAAWFVVALVPVAATRLRRRPKTDG